MKLNQRMWIEANPFRIWRNHRKLAAHVVAAQLGVSEATVRGWEWGHYVPQLENLEKVAGLMEWPLGRLTEEWLAWYHNRPQESQ